MIHLSVDSKKVSAMLARYPKEAGRAAEIALDRTAVNIRDGIKGTMKRVFDRPTTFTLNSLKITYTRNHKLKASVWFKEPERMADHYLVPQVEGGKRKFKGFELALDRLKFIPGKGARMTRSGNISTGQIRQVLSVMGRAEMYPGYQANLTAKSAKTNKKSRDYVYLPRGSSGGALPPGIYQRVKQSGKGFGGIAKSKLGKFGDYQKGRKRGRFFSIIRARGLKPIMLVGRQNKAVKPLLPFYSLADKIYDRKFRLHFERELSKQLDL
jgi:hypothetical protein